MAESDLSSLLRAFVCSSQIQLRVCKILVPWVLCSNGWRAWWWPHAPAERLLLAWSYLPFLKGKGLACEERVGTCTVLPLISFLLFIGWLTFLDVTGGFQVSKSERNLRGWHWTEDVSSHVIPELLTCHQADVQFLCWTCLLFFIFVPWMCVEICWQHGSGWFPGLLLSKNDLWVPPCRVCDFAPAFFHEISNPDLKPMYSEHAVNRCVSGFTVSIVTSIYIGASVVYHMLLKPTLLGGLLFNLTWLLALWSYIQTSLTDPGTPNCPEWQDWSRVHQGLSEGAHEARWRWKVWHGKVMPSCLLLPGRKKSRIKMWVAIDSNFSMLGFHKMGQHGNPGQKCMKLIKSRCFIARILLQWRYWFHFLIQR